LATPRIGVALLFFARAEVKTQHGAHHPKQWGEYQAFYLCQIIEILGNPLARTEHCPRKAQSGQGQQTSKYDPGPLAGNPGVEAAGLDGCFLELGCFVELEGPQ